MNRPIDWKKISELKRQAAPMPEVPLGDMLSELLESETGMPAWDAPAALAALPMHDLASAAPPAEPAEPTIPDAEPVLAQAAPQLAEPIPAPAPLPMASAPLLVHPPLASEVQQVAVPSLSNFWQPAPLAAAEELPVEAARLDRPFESADTDFKITPSLEIHSKVEMALSELSETSSRAEAIDTNPPLEFTPPLDLTPPLVLVEALPASEASQPEPAAEPWKALMEPSPIAAIEAPKPAEIRPAVPPAPPLEATPAAGTSVPQAAAADTAGNMDSMLAMLLEASTHTAQVPLSQPPAPPVTAPQPAQAVSQLDPVRVDPVQADMDLGNSDLDELISAMDREVERSPFAEKTGDSILSPQENPLSRESCLVFSLAGVKFGIPIHQVVELDKLPRVTRVPNVPYWVRGVTNLRGEILSVLDLRQLLGMERSEHLDRGRILVVRIGEESSAALVVDEVSGITRYDQQQLKAPDTQESARIIPLLDGIYSSEELALKVLNIDKLMATPELRQLEAA